MKVRLHNNSVRLRLSQTEVSLLASGKRVEQKIIFSKTSHLMWSAESTSEVNKVVATFEGQHLAVRLPTERVLQWAQSDQVSIESNHQIDEARFLNILIEKDFKCLHRTLPENDDSFPNPLAGNS